MRAAIVDVIRRDWYIETEDLGTRSAASFAPQFVSFGSEDAFDLAAFRYFQSLFAFELQE